MHSSEGNNVVIYQPDATLSLDVKIEKDSVWLTQNQMAELFQTTKQNISLHTNNVFKEGELIKDAVVKKSLTTASDGKNYQTTFYNLDVIISVGYRVKSIRGTQFRQWATKILNSYMLKGYAMAERIENLEHRLTKSEEKIDFFIRTALPPVEGIFFDGQIFDAHSFINKLIRAAKQRIVLIDNYIDETVLTQLDYRNPDVNAKIFTATISK